MTDRVIEIFNGSLRRCRQSPRFLDTFYGCLLAATPEMPALFESTDFHHQKRTLMASFDLLLTAAQRQHRREEASHLQHLADVHAGRGIARALYDLWLECLINAVAIHDPDYSPTVASAWREFMAPGLEVMRAAAPF